MPETFCTVRRGGLEYDTPASFARRGGVRAAFTTRLGGVSEGGLSSLNLGLNRGDDPARVRENYLRMLRAMELSEENLVLTRQVHGVRVACASERDRGLGYARPREDEADGLITDRPGLVLVGMFADCVPILLYDPVRRAVGVLHAGWRGTAQRIAARGVAEMVRAFGCRSADLLAAVGPSIGSCCFETHADVPQALGAEAAAHITPAGDKFLVDLRGCNAAQLEDAGLPRENISVSGRCTCCDAASYFSHRRDGAARGSLAAVIALEEEHKQ